MLPPPRSHPVPSPTLFRSINAAPKTPQPKLAAAPADGHAVGRAPPDTPASLNRRWRAVEEKIRVAMDSAWRRTTPQDNPLLAQMREQVAEAEQRLERAKAAGDQRRVREAEQALASKRQFLALAEKAG